MKSSVLKRMYNIKERLYIEAQYLCIYGFGIGQSIKYKVDQQRKRVTVYASANETKKKVAQTTQRTGKKVPVIDIKGEDVRSFFARHQQVELEISKGKIIFTVLEEAGQKSISNVVDLEEARREKENVGHRSYAVRVNEFARVVNYDQLTIFDLFRAEQNEQLQGGSSKVPPALKEKAIKMISLFSGSGTLDLGFKNEGYDIIFANDRFEKKALRDSHIKTYQHNIGDHIIMRDVMSLTKEDIPKADICVAGIPCIDFSLLNTKKNFRDSESDHHPIVEKAMDIIQWSKAKAFLIENVEKFITVKNGVILKRFRERFSNFGIVAKIIDATSLGSAQKRRRAFILGIENDVPEIELPHLAECRTVRDAFKDVENAPQQDLFFKPTPKTLERMQYVPEGGCIKDVPEHLRSAKKKFNDFCMRLGWDLQTKTLAHVQDHVIFHPSLDRYLTVRETARLFSLPDDFTFIGSLTAIFEMLKNAVDYRVSRFLAQTIKRQLIPLL
ncbi:DNA cytosine methyltransferase [Brevibacillus reuszeri]|uniref:DNA cytosine methyltransferase n=1 Tax=Brevibacillus reuszeri TaxID=54915 RepID=UPI000CCC0D76|nr:DNA (cytosine-5-)-methyltransferase [Brevibacillus reuszeri]